MNAGRFQSIDSLRGLCACAVALLHFWSFGPLTSSAFIRNSWVFVHFFFVISGFVIAWNYGGKLVDWAAVKRFAILRIGRLYPLHAFMLLLLLALECVAYFRYPLLLNHAPFDSDRSPAALLSSVFLVQGLAGPNPVWNGPSWSISLEMWVYAAFALATLSRWVRALVLPAVALMVLITCQVVDLGPTALVVAPYVLCFALGCWMCSIYRRTASIVPRESPWWTLLEMAVFAGVIATTIIQPLTGIPLMALAVLVFAFEKGWVGKLLRSGPLVTLGELSYSIYMVHWFLLSMAWIAMNFARSHGLDLWTKGTVAGFSTQLFGRNAVEGTLFSIAYLLITIAISFATFRWIEQPGRRWARELTRSSPHPSLSAPRVTA